MASVIAVNALQYIINPAINFLTGIDDKDATVVWFGHNYFIDTIQKAFISRKKRIHYIIDNDAEKWGMAAGEGLVVFPVEQITKKYKKSAVFMMSSNFGHEMRAQLLSLGVNQEQIIMMPSNDDCHLLAKAHLLKHTDGLKKIGLKEHQALILAMLKTIHEACTANGLRYFLGGGTMLGAVRHKGFIPWDNDADIYMPLDDYLQLPDIFPEGGRFEIVNWQKYPGYSKCYSKLVDNHTIMYVGGYPVKMLLGVAVCIFPLAGYPSGEKELSLKLRTNELLHSNWRMYIRERGIVAGDVPDLRRDIYDLKYNLRFDESPIIGNAHLMHKSVWHVPRSVFEESVLMEFEGELFPVPKDYDCYLKRRYGDYMQIPPDDKKRTHASLPFWKNKTNNFS